MLGHTSTFNWHSSEGTSSSPISTMCVSSRKMNNVLIQEQSWWLQSVAKAQCKCVHVMIGSHVSDVECRHIPLSPPWSPSLSLTALAHCICQSDRLADSCAFKDQPPIRQPCLPSSVAGRMQCARGVTLCPTPHAIYSVTHGFLKYYFIVYRSHYGIGI